MRVSDSPTQVELRWDGGLSIEPPTIALQPGQPSTGIRITDFHYENDRWLLSVEGMAGRTYELRLHGEEFTRVEGAELVGREASVSRIAVTIRAGELRSARQIMVAR